MPKKASRDARSADIERYRIYDRLRNDRPDRVQAREIYHASERGKTKMAIGSKRWAIKNPEKRTAQVALGNAVRVGKILKGACKICGKCDGVQAHHSDYSKPLDVEWFCPKHHGEYHREERNLPRAT